MIETSVPLVFRLSYPRGRVSMGTAQRRPGERLWQAAEKCANCYAEPFACHPERSEGSRSGRSGKLREASRSVLKPKPRFFAALRMTEPALSSAKGSKAFSVTCY